MADGTTSPLFDFEAGEFVTDIDGSVATATEAEALAEIIVKVQNTARGVYLIYADTENEELNHKYGSDTMDILTRQSLTEAVRISELKRVMREAIIYDPWVLDVYDIVLVKSGVDSYTASFNLKTIYDKEINVGGVEING